MERLLIVGLERPEASEIIARTGLPAVASVTLPRVRHVYAGQPNPPLVDGDLAWARLLVSKVTR